MSDAVPALGALAYFSQKALSALGFTCSAYLTSMLDDLGIPWDPVIPGQYIHQLIFRFYRIQSIRQSKPSGYSFNMRINHYPRFPEYVTSDHIGCLAAYSGERGQFIYPTGYFSVETRKQFSRSPNAALRP